MLDHESRTNGKLKLLTLSHRSVMEEIHVRSNMALAQKRFVHEVERGVDEDSDELLKMTAQVVSRILWCLVPTNQVDPSLFCVVQLLPGQGDIEVFCRYG